MQRATPQDRLPDRPAARARDWIAAPRWPRVALVGIAALAAVLFTWDLGQNGYANTYYSAAVLAATQSWKAFFFGALDAGSFITVDKPPLSLWVMALSARVFGFNAWSMLVPQAAAGVATVVVLWDAVRRLWGEVAGLLAALVMALTPVAALMFRFNNPDALLTLLLVLSGWALVHALVTGRTRWLLLSAAMVGLGFNTKYLQADLVVPALVLAYAVAGPGRFSRRVLQLLGAGAVLVVVSGWWVAIVTLIPAGSRPFIGGSTNNSVLDLVFGYDGFGRLLGGFGGPGGGGARSGPPGGGGGMGGGFGGAAGWLRMANSELGGQASWLIPLALTGLGAGLWRTRRDPRTSLSRAGYLLWGGWFFVTAVVFSYMSGVFHPYYTVALAPAIAALVGAGAVDLWALGRSSRFGGLVLAAALVVTAWWGATLLGRTPEFAPWLGPAELAVAAAASVALAVLLAVRARRWLALVAVAVAFVAVLSGPAAYAFQTASRAQNGSIVSAGPTVAAGGAFDGRAGAFAPGGQPRAGQAPPAGVAAPGGAMPGAGPAGGQTSQALLGYLTSHQGGATWIVATSGSMQGASIQLATGKPVLMMGGFTGSDPAPTLAQLKSLIASGQLKYILVGGGQAGGPMGRGASSEVTTWVTQHCTQVSSVSGLYSCSQESTR